MPVPDESVSTVDGCEVTPASLIQSGKLFLLLEDFPAAARDLSKAVELLSTQFGEGSPECAEALLLYGKALLEVSRMETGVLCNAMEGISIDSELGQEDGKVEAGVDSQVENPETVPQDEKEDIKGKVAEALEDNFNQFDKIAKTHLLQESEDSDSEMDEDEVILEAVQDDESDKPVASKDKVSVENETETAEDTDNLQLSWEVAELAKIAYQKMAETLEDKEEEAWMKYCEAMMVLGEISLENGNYSRGVEDLTLCLKKRKEILPADSRFIAETHYALGLVQYSLEMFTEVETSLNAAIDVLKDRLENLKNLSSKLDAEDKDGSKKPAENIDDPKDLENLIAEIVKKNEEFRARRKEAGSNSDAEEQR